ncbi:hypothetical protein QYM36_016868 [Artemia franciscana]|uniref:Reverse transcriptase domain-containing protein n=1 Tax=Artemia franciscana TaxID=6661 RepID=A0AA88H6U6_ARTSF|nr:hypothetical protein QYM36_016868 [Artemia franciscana]
MSQPSCMAQLFYAKWMPAQDEFQRHMEEAFEGLGGVTIIIDDILVYGSNQEEHDRKLKAVMERALKKAINSTKTNAVSAQAVYAILAI